MMDDEPYVCLGCKRVFRTCPDHDAHDCPDCGEKVMPKRLQNMRERRAGRHLACAESCEAEVLRASGDVACAACGETYREHPRCAGSRYPKDEPESFMTSYAANVLCDGTHVHL